MLSEKSLLVNHVGKGIFEKIEYRNFSCFDAFIIRQGVNRIRDSV